MVIKHSKILNTSYLPKDLAKKQTGVFPFCFMLALCDQYIFENRKRKVFKILEHLLQVHLTITGVICTMQVGMTNR